MDVRYSHILIIVLLISGCIQTDDRADDSDKEDETQPVSININVSEETASVGEFEIPLGDLVSGVTLGGPHSGRKMYLLTNVINLPDCWMDSVHWTGDELFYGVTSLDFSKLLSGVAFEYNPKCSLPKDQITGDFDIYRAKPLDGQWQISHQSMNSDTADAGMSLSGNTMAYTIYPLPPKSWDIYFVDKISDNNWSAPEPFEQNSPCKEDNPELYADGKKIIFESNRKDPLGKSCYVPEVNDVMKLWYSEKTTAGGWSQPKLLSGAPNEGEKNTQPWVDEGAGYLYWTADKSCGCIRRIRFDGESVSGQYEDIVIPDMASMLDGSADGKVVFVGEYSQSNGSAFLACAIASEDGPFLDRWSISINLCIIP